jgi:hypothetical protein
MRKRRNVAMQQKDENAVMQHGTEFALARTMPTNDATQHGTKDALARNVPTGWHGLCMGKDRANMVRCKCRVSPMPNAGKSSCFSFCRCYHVHT